MEVLPYILAFLAVTVLLVYMAKRHRLPMYIVFACTYFLGAILLVTIGSIAAQVASESIFLSMSGGVAVLTLLFGVASLILKRVISLPFGAMARNPIDPYFIVDAQINTLEDAQNLL